MKKLTFSFLFPICLGFAILSTFTSCGEDGPKSREEKIKDMIEQINNSPEWIGGLKKDAEAQKQSVDSLVLKAAIYMIDKEEDKQLSREERIEKVRKSIVGTPEWLGNLTKEAATKKIPVDTMVLQAATFMIDKEDGKYDNPPAAAAPAPAAQ